jgi:hypothetical protein
MHLDHLLRIYNSYAPYMRSSYFLAYASVRVALASDWMALKASKNRTRVSSLAAHKF